MAFPDLLGLSTSAIRGSVVQVRGGVTGTSSAPVCDGFTLFQTWTSRVQPCLRERYEQLPRGSSREVV